MFSFKHKLDKNLYYYLTRKTYKEYRVLIKCKSLQEGIAKKITSYKGDLIYSFPLSNLICAKLNASSINRLLEYPEVSYMCFDEYLFLCGISVSSANKISLSSKLNLTGKGVNVGVIDSGVYPHQDLLAPSNKIEEFIDLVSNYKYPYDDNGHGTSMCGIIAGSGLSSKYMYSGIAPDAKLTCYKAFDKLGKGYISDVLFSLEKIISEDKCKVICLPCELLTHNYYFNDLFNTVFLKAVDKNISIIVPSGSNIGLEGSIMGISTLKSCITVGGVNTSHTMTAYKYSSCGPYEKYIKPDLSAACVNIASLNSNTSFIPEENGIKLYPRKLSTHYKSFSGTSLAAAFISGVVALIYEKNPNLSFEDVKSILKLACDLGELSKNINGDGIINLSRLRDNKL